MTPSKTSDAHRPSTGRRIGRAVALTVAGVLLLIGAVWWVIYIKQTAGGYKAGGLDGQFIVFGFLLWAVPWALGTGVAVAVLSLRQLAARVILSLSGLLLLIAIVTSIYGAH